MKKTLLFLVLALIFTCIIYLSACTPSHTHDYKSTVTLPTCTEKGYTTYVCSDCRNSYIDNYTNPNGHSYSQWTITKWPTTTEEGLQERECACGDKETEVLSSSSLSQGLEYSLNSDMASYSLIGIGDCRDTVIIIPTTYDGLPVTSIGTRAFQDSNLIKSINIPDTVTYISDRAFYYCTSLETVNIPSAITTIKEFTFYACKSLKNITIPESVATIEEYAFAYCESLTNIVIPNSVTSIGEGVFENCSSLESINMPYNGNEYSFGYYFYTGNSSIPENLKTVILTSATEIGYNFFINCQNIETIVLPEGITEIQRGTFSDCTNLKTINIPSSVTKIGEYAFNNCRSLEAIDIHDGITTIEAYAFYNCPLKEVNIPDSLTSPIGEYAIKQVGTVILPRIDGDSSIVFTTFVDIFGGEKYAPHPHSIIIEGGNKINDSAFENCGLYNISIPNSIKSIGENAFAYCYFEVIDIPDSVETIGDSAFYQCESLANIVIPNSVTSIGSYAFSGCRSLVRVSLPDSLSTIESYTFSNCESLKSITIPNSVKIIGAEAFRDCQSLDNIIIGNSVTTIKDYALDCGIKNIDIPDSVVSIGFMALPHLDQISLGKSVKELPTLYFANIEVSKDNPYYSSIDGNLYDKAGTTLIRYAVKKSDTSFTVPQTVTSISAVAFRDASLEHITLPDSVTSIADYTFAYIRSLESITMPNSVKIIGAEAFRDCTALTSITIEGNGQAVIETGAFANCTSLTTVVTSDYSISEIGSYAFDGCVSLKNFIMPYSLTKVGAYSFRGCTSLTSFSIPYSTVEIIEVGAFEGCTSLELIYLPPTLTDIASKAFSGCTALTTISFHGTSNTWEGIYKGSYWNNNTGKYIIYCSDVNIAKDGTVIQK